MTIYQRTDAVFEAAGVPGFFQMFRRTDRYPEMPDTFAVYNISRTRSPLCADDIEIARMYTVHIDVYGKGDVSGAVEAIRAALLAANYDMPETSDRPDLYGLALQYHTAISTSYVDYDL